MRLVRLKFYLVGALCAAPPFPNIAAADMHLGGTAEAALPEGREAAATVASPATRDEKYRQHFENVCLATRGNGGCNFDILTPEDRARVLEVQDGGILSASQASEATGERRRLGCAENGSCRGDISEITGLPKNKYIPGYVRKDGGHVRGHYRGSSRY